MGFLNIQPFRYDLPVNYNDLSQNEKREIRQQYIQDQGGMTYKIPKI